MSFTRSQQIGALIILLLLLVLAVYQMR